MNRAKQNKTKTAQVDKNQMTGRDQTEFRYFENTQTHIRLQAFSINLIQE